MVDYDVSDQIATILLNRPEKLNALTLDMAMMLVATFDKADCDPQVRAVIVTGAGSHFVQAPTCPTRARRSRSKMMARWCGISAE